MRRIPPFIFFTPFSDGYLILNGLSGAILYADEEMMNFIMNCTKSEFKSREEHKPFIDMLEENCILVDEEFNPDEFIEVMLGRHKFYSLIHSYVLVLTYACNMKCVYCYESKPSGQLMTSELGGKISKMAEERAKNLGCKRISVTLYGGEPLLNLKTGTYVCSKLRRFCEVESIDFDAGIITNGTLLTPSVAKELSEYGIGIAQVTIDGPPDIHDKRRPFHNGKGTFDIIFNNIKTATDHIKLNIRINIDRTNRESVPELIDIIANEFKGKCIISFSKVGADTPACKSYQPFCLSDEEYATYLVKLIKLTMKKGLDIPVANEFMPSPFACGAFSDHTFVIDPHGKIYKCWGVIGMETYAVGDIGEKDKLQP